MLVAIVLSILLTWLVCAGVCIGIGSLVLASFRAAYSPTDAFWTGVAAVTGILQIYHLLRPVDAAAAFLLSVVALAGIVLNRGVILDGLRKVRRAGLWPMLCCVSVWVVIALRAAGPCEHYDTGLYGAQAIRWMVSYPIVPGLGNLTGQLGFNSSVFLWFAALDQGPWRDLAHHLFVGFLLATLFASVVPACFRVLGGGHVAASDWFMSFLVIPGGFWATNEKIVGANTDLPVTVVCLVAAWMTFKGLEEETPGQSGNGNGGTALAVAALLFAVAITFKLSSLVLGGLGWTVASVRMWTLGSHDSGRKRLVAGSIVLCAAVLLPWMSRGVILTGYPLFPSSALGIAVDWKMEPENVNGEAAYARWYGKNPLDPLAARGDAPWVGPWLQEVRNYRAGFIVPLFITLVGGVVGIVMGRRQPIGSRRWLWLLLPSAAGVLFWFLEAPAVRFGESALWVTAATLGTLGVTCVFRSARGLRFVLFGLLAIAAWCTRPRMLWPVFFRPLLSVHTFLPLPEAHMVSHRTASGLIVHVPVGTNQCWNAPLPCSLYFNDSLHLRRPGELGSGFVLTGLRQDMALAPQVPDSAPKICVLP